jgi:hypothetical protein
MKFKLMTSTALLGQVTPILIEPHYLKHLLLQIQSRLDARLQLPFKLESELHEYYQQIKSDVVVLDSGIGIVFSIPLVSIDSQFHIFKAFNIPIPYHNTSFAFTYKINNHHIALSQDRSKFVYLTTEEFIHCSVTRRKFCHITSPMRFVSQNLHHCLINKLYSQSLEHCQIIIHHDNIILPLAVNLDKGDWIIVSNQSQVFTLLCKSDSKHVHVSAPIGHVHLPLGCAAQSQWLRLPTTYYQYASENLLPEVDLFRSNISILDAVPFDIKQTLITTPEKIVPLVRNGQSLDDIKNRIKKYLSKAQVPPMTGTHSLLMSALIPIGGILSIAILIVIVLVRCRVLRLATTRHLASAAETPEADVPPVVEVPPTPAPPSVPASMPVSPP